MRPAPNWRLIIGLAGLALLGLVALIGPLLAPADPLKVTWVIKVSSAKYIVPPYAPSAQYPLGSDHMGRDILSGLLSGARYTLLFTGLAVAVGFLAAIPAGLLAGWRGGLLGSAVQTVAAGNMAIPQLIGIAIFLARIRVTGPGWPLWVQTLAGAAVMGLWAAPRVADMVRRLALSVAREPYLEGAVAGGARPWQILRRHLLPNLAPALATSAVLEYASVLRMLALLGLFDIGIAPTNWYEGNLSNPSGLMAYPVVPEWASYMGMGFGGIRESPWVVIYPGLAFTVAALVFQAAGEGLRQRWRLRR